MEKETAIILIDDRVGSRHYASLIGNAATITRLEYGDAAWSGSEGTSVGVEIKKIFDAVGCLYSGRLADHQIPGLKANYDVVYLVVEGTWRADPVTGILQYYKGDLGKWGRWLDISHGSKRLTYSSFERWLATMELVGGVHIRSTPSQEETAALLSALFNWFQREDHHSFHVMQDPTGVGAELSRPAMLRRMIALLPRIGWDRSGILVKRFNSVRDLVEAPDEKWFIEGQIAEGTVAKIKAALNGDVCP